MIRKKNLLKAELKPRGVSYNKISRGGFTAVFLLQVLTPIGARELRLD